MTHGWGGGGGAGLPAARATGVDGTTAPKGGGADSQGRIPVVILPTDGANPVATDASPVKITTFPNPSQDAPPTSGGGDGGFDSGGGGGGYSGGSGGGSTDHTDWKVFMSGGTDAVWAGGGLIHGRHPGDNQPVPVVIQGSHFVGFPLLQSPGADPNDYQLVNYTWTFPTGAVKGYGTFGQWQETAGPNGGSTYTVFTGGPTMESAQDPENFPFDGDDLNYTSPGTDHAVDSFYWGPKSSGNLDISITATFVKIVNGQQADSFTGSDTVTFNVLKPTGNIRGLKFGTAGLSTMADEFGQVWIGLDQNSQVIPKTNPARPVGIHYEGSIPGGVGVGSFTMIQTMQTQSTKQWNDAAGVSHTEKNGYYVDPNTNLPAIDPATGQRKTINDFPVLDTLGGGVSYGFRLNDDQLGPQAQTPSPGISSATVLGPGGIRNKLYGSDSPGTPLPTPPSGSGGWVSGTFSRTDNFTITLMYNPDPNASIAASPGGPASSMWVPVGDFKWGWSATAAFSTLYVTPMWSQISASQTPGTYTPTTKFPTWSAGRDGPMKQGFDTFFP